MGYIEDLRKLIGHKRIVLNGSLVIIENKDGKILMQKRTYPKGEWFYPEKIPKNIPSTHRLVIDDYKNGL